MMSKILRSISCIALTLALLTPFIYAYAAMQSTNYKISFDTVDNGGRNSSSTNYTIEDSIGEQATGISSSTNYTIEAGYQQMYGSYISITSPSNITLPAIGGLVGGVSTSSVAWSVLTDDSAGYILYVQASTTPALVTASNSAFADYVPAGGTTTPDFTFSISPSTSAFGFSPQGPDIVPRFKDNGSTCNTGTSDTAYACWDGFSTTSKNIAESSSSNQPSGATTTIQLQAQIGSSKIQDSGSYSATIITTALAL